MFDRQFKVPVRNAEESRLVQEFFFSKGAVWFGDGRARYHTSPTETYGSRAAIFFHPEGSDHHRQAYLMFGDVNTERDIPTVKIAELLGMAGTQAFMINPRR